MASPDICPCTDIFHSEHRFTMWPSFSVGDMWFWSGEGDKMWASVWVTWQRLTLSVNCTLPTVVIFCVPKHRDWLGHFVDKKLLCLNIVKYDLSVAQRRMCMQLLLLLLQMKRLKWRCRENAAGALYKIITREKLVMLSYCVGDQRDGSYDPCHKVVNILLLFFIVK